MQSSTRKSITFLCALFALSTSILLSVFNQLPEFPEDHKQVVQKLPRSMDDAKELARVLSLYRENHYYSVLTCLAFVYIFLQTFAIPGSIFLSVVLGFLFNFYVALFVICMCSATGATLCYLASGLVGPPLLEKYCKARIDQWKASVNHHRQHMLNYIIFLRITPFLPNWFINISSPVLDVSLWPFFIGTFLGVAPPSFVAVSAGQNIYNLTTAGDALSYTSILMLAIFAILSMLPVIFQNKLKAHFS
ncbi:transmembrane protein 41B-like [Symsagittifera roscoffensis]|uniref:transmembrane protein 41B-like n=1 Tax=Symsagittifera roscoffensis TaxID=84072 RepID=UPI00307C5D0B